MPNRGYRWLLKHEPCREDIIAFNISANEGIQRFATVALRETNKAIFYKRLFFDNWEHVPKFMSKRKVNWKMNWLVMIMPISNR